METNGSLLPGINFHKLPVSGGAAGLLVAVGSTLIFLFGIPLVRWFLAGAFALGLGVALILRVFHRHSAILPQQILKLPR
jgi:hypothetical protein